MEDPADQADAVSVTGRHQRVRAPHLQCPALRLRMTASSAWRCPGVRTDPDIPLPVCRFFRSFSGVSGPFRESCQP